MSYRQLARSLALIDTTLLPIWDMVEVEVEVGMEANLRLDVLINSRDYGEKRWN